LICFDLDGVLVNSKEIHFDSLNLALAEIDSKFVITIEEHIKKYDGLPTKNKLELLHQEKNSLNNFLIKSGKERYSFLPAGVQITIL
jgi:phosphoglycolate phosphatase-like HAD superfamily hydrolase